MDRESDAYRPQFNYNYRNGMDIDSDNYRPPSPTEVPPVAGTGLRLPRGSGTTGLRMTPEAIKAFNEGYDIARGDRILTEARDRDIDLIAAQARAREQRNTAKAQGSTGSTIYTSIYLPPSGAGNVGMSDPTLASSMPQSQTTLTLEVSASTEKLFLSKNQITPERKNAYITDNGYKDVKSGAYAKDPLDKLQSQKIKSFETEIVLAKIDTSGSLIGNPAQTYLLGSDANFIGFKEVGNYYGEAKLGLGNKGDSFGIPNSLDAKAGAGARYGVQWAGAAGQTSGSTEVFGTTLGAGVRAEGGIGSGATLISEASLKIKPGGATGVTVDISANAGAEVAALRAQGKVEFPFQVGRLEIKPFVSIEGQAGALGASAGTGFKTYETRTGGNAYVGGGASASIGGKIKLELDWNWKPPK
jgi:hypothetical protein